MRTPTPRFAIADVPAAFVPIRLPWTTTPFAAALTPNWLPEMTFPKPAVVPPITAFTLSPPNTCTPGAPLPTADDPVVSVPM